MQRPPRVLFFGMPGNFSLPPLQALLAGGIEVCAIVVPASRTPGFAQAAIAQREQPCVARPPLPVFNSSLHINIVQLAWKHSIPLWEVARMSDVETLSSLAAYQTDAICVACFPLRIPAAMLAMPRLGCLNVHPSLLPANRGPMPLFWTFRHDLRQTGITIHFMDEGMDTGNILAQQFIEVPDGIDYAQLEMRCAIQGGKLLAHTIWELHAGRARSLKQDEDRSSYFPFPGEQDYIVPVSEWSARHVYNFICGVAQSHRPVKLHVGEEYIYASQAISYSHKDISDRSGTTYCWYEDDKLCIRCKEGWVSITNPAIHQ
ncbi:MAG: hypothetical protein NVS4B7_13740 [Ktedonobacteraceae bacterium]